jgi:3-hydroxyisobutyrate dehydrogenase-like beta-hydroxyacid dehydrogenase
MGKGMASNLINKLSGLETLVVWNRGNDACQALANQYPGKVTIVPTAADVIKSCTTTYCMLSTEEASKAVFDPPGGVFDAVTEGKIIVDCATLSVERMVYEHERITAKGGRFIEAPVSGSKVPAENGQLIFLCGGDEAIYNEVSPALDCMGKAKFLFGPVGQGSRVKLIVNMIMGSMMGSFAEGMKLGETLDLPLDKILQVLDLGAMANPMFKMKGPNFINDKFDPHFPLKHQQKDMKLALELAKQNNVELPISSKANDAFVSVLEQRGDEDFSAVYKAVNKK